MADALDVHTQAPPPIDRVGVIKLLAPFLILIAAESVILLQQIAIGLFIHGAVLLGLFWIIARGNNHRVYEALIFVPLLRLLNLGTGVIRFDPFVWLLGVYGLLSFSIVLVMREYEFGFEELGLTIPGSWGQVGVVVSGIVLGVFLGGVQWFLDLETLPVTPTVQNAIAAILVMGVVVGFVEELLFRGLLQQWLATTVSDWVAVLVVSVLFGFMHSIWFAPTDIVFAFIVSLLIGFVYAYTRNFWFIWAVHTFINVMAFAVLPLAMR